MPRSDDWLALTVEDAIDPALPICDPHVHLWDFPGDRYLLEEFSADVAGGHNVEQLIFIECLTGYRDSGPVAFAPVGETDLIASVARSRQSVGAPNIAAIVGFADLRLGSAVEEVLLAHIEAGAGLVKGIRYAGASDADPAIRDALTHPPADLFQDAQFQAGVSQLAKEGLSFDAWIFHHQIDVLVELAQACPDVVIILDHMGTPIGVGPYANRWQETVDRWFEGLRQLTRCPNVWVKLGGIGMSVTGHGWHRRAKPPTSQELAAAWGPAIRRCIELFGSERCMFESNFPIDKVSCSYTTLWNAFKIITADASPDERKRLFRDSALHAYGVIT